MRGDLVQSHHIGFGIKGFYRWGSYAITARMNNDNTQHRLRVLEFWEKHGLAAALDYSGKSKRYRRRVRSHRPKGYRPEQVGECVGLDAIERRLGGMKRYLLTYIDEVSDYAVALAVSRLNS